ncbi:hypothetical protein PS1_037640 [Malus domestica]|uniref:Uncharacterized protein n=1 Tax=Malus domestica TaxID=3750 RepID=A0A498JM60_MALDO|nr:hypothetical protein DVH24_009670 [Malus domestica]
MQTKTNANTLKINDYLKHIGSLKNELEEAQSNAVEMEPSQIPDLNASTQGLPDTLKDKKEPSPVPHAAKIQVQKKTPIMESMSIWLKRKFKKHQQRNQLYQ